MSLTISRIDELIDKTVIDLEATLDSCDAKEAGEFADVLSTLQYLRQDVARKEVADGDND